jgi:hypothetical protein
VSEKLVSFRDLRPLGIPYCRLHLNRLVDRKLFPEPVWGSPNRKYWRLADVERWIASRPTIRPHFPPAGGADAAD